VVRSKNTLQQTTHPFKSKHFLAAEIKGPPGTEVDQFTGAQYLDQLGELRNSNAN
jgi:hypothetical protein